MTAVIYARFSSDRQTEASIDAQVRACTEYADKRSIFIKSIYKDEAVSGTTANRAAYQEMLADAFNGSFDTILIHKYDRIARNLEEQVNLRKRLKQLNIRLIAVAQDFGEGKDAELSKGIQWVLGEYYSANLSEETKKGHKETALKALHNGGYPPFGYDVVNQKYVINDKEAYWVRRMVDVCISGGSYKDLVDEMAASEIVGKRGKPIKYPQIYEILRNEKYTGTYVYSINEESDRRNRRAKPNAIRIQDAFPAIISKDEYEEIRNILESRKRAGHPKHRLSGLVFCECGAKMHLYRTSRKGHHYTKFICSKHCGAHSIDAEYLNNAVNLYFDELLSEKNISDVELALSKYHSEIVEHKKQFEKDRIEKISLKKEQLNNLLDALMSGSFKDNQDFLNENISLLRNEIDILEHNTFKEVDDKKVRNWLDEVKYAKESPKILIDRIEVNNDEVTIYSVFGNIGCGGRIDIFPKLLWEKKI